MLQVADLSNILYDAMKSEDFALVSNRISKENRQNIRMQVLQQRSFALAALGKTRTWVNRFM